MTAPIVVPPEDFAALAAGDGDTNAALRAGQLSKRLLLLRAVVDQAAERAPALHHARRLYTAFQLLADARRADRHAADKIIMQPRVGAWAEHCIRGLAHPVPPEPAPTISSPPIQPPRHHHLEDQLGDLAALAVAAAHAAGIDFDLPLASNGGNVAFPGVGVVAVGWTPRALRARGRRGIPTIEVSDHDASVEVRPADPTERPGWQPFRRLSVESAGIGLDVAIDDVDPFRDLHGLGATTRLSADEVELWHARLHEAWRLLTTRHRATAAAIADGVMCLVPILPTGQAPELSASSADSFGAISLTRPRDGLAFASSLVHEFQHTKLSALLDLVPLHSRSDTGLYYAPWRADARPLRGLLQGTYAYLGLTAFMAVQRDTEDPAQRRFAEFEFARFRDQVWRASGTMTRSGSLTGYGDQFVTTMRQRIRKLRQAQVAPAVRKWARRTNEDHRTTWRLANLACDGDDVDRQARAFLAGRPPAVPAADMSHHVVRATTTFRSSARLALARRRLVNAGTLVEEDAAAEPSATADAFPADVRLVTFDDPAGALELYRSGVTANPDRLDLWAGLSAARRRTTRRPGDPLVVRPEVVLHVHRKLRERTGESADPVELAAWIAG